ncbi:hypothetical protein FS837_001455 [Tulasnella sp. UAMH 9824]|nr:hypothetical protein FS837_001455 [Tulasnella sp. UAMH 9824]
MSMESLPEEIFIEIIEILILPYNDLRAPRLNTLRLVCRRWDELIQQTPSLWTYIWNGTNNIYVERALRCSGTLGLKVRVSHWPKVKNRDKERFWSLLLPHLDRWEHAVLSGNLEDNIPHALARKGASRLRSLALDSDSWKYETIHGPFPGWLPSLESLRIQNFGVSWSTQQYPLARLKRLYINLPQRAGFGQSDLLLRQIIDSLRECQQLVSLHLTGIHTSPDILTENLTPIILPNLEVISLSLPRSVDCKLLETIHVPKCRLIVIRPWYWASALDQLLKALENLAGGIGTAKISNCATVEAQESYYKAYLGCDLRAVDSGSSFMRLRLEVNAHLSWKRCLQETVPFFHRWIGSFGPDNGWDIRITTYSLVFMTGILLAFATYLPTALTLTITNAITDLGWSPNASLNVLYVPDEPAFPCLEQLELWYCKAFAGGIIRIIAKRVIRKDTPTPLRMRIKLPRDVDEVERVELAWLSDQLPNLIIQETPVFLNE